MKARKTAKDLMRLLLALSFPVFGLQSCFWAPDMEILTYEPEEAQEGITLFGIAGQPEFLDLKHGYISAVPMFSRYPLPSRIEPVWEFTDREGGLALDTKILPNGNILAARGLPFGNHLEEIDPRTNEVVWSYRGLEVHHDADPLPDGNVMFISGSFVRDPVHGLMHVDHVRVVDRNGNLLWDWSLYENDPEGNPVDPTECEPVMQVPWFEWSHCNAVTFVPAPGWTEEKSLTGSLYLNSRQFSRIYKIDYPSGEIEWILGDNGDFGHGLFSQAHDPEYSFETDAQGNPVTRILLLDNGSCRRSGPCPPDEEPCPPGLEFYSRALEIRIENEDDPAGRNASISWKWPSPSSPDFETNRFYSEVMGDADRLPNGNVLITSSAEEGHFLDLENPSYSHLIEVKPDGTLTGGKVVWEMKTNKGYWIYRAQRIPVEDWPF